MLIHNINKKFFILPKILFYQKNFYFTKKFVLSKNFILPIKFFILPKKIFYFKKKLKKNVDAREIFFLSLYKLKKACIF